MIYSKLNVYDAYACGIKTRLKQRAECGDMPFSVFKLLECHHDFTSTIEELYRIGAYIRGDKSLKQSFVHCMCSDKHIWVKSIAVQNCFSLGRNLVGALNGLAGDGVPKAVEQKITRTITCSIPDLLDLGESARIETKTEWKRIGKLLGTGSCELDRFNNDCIELIEWVLNILIVAKPGHPSGPFKNFEEERQKSLEAYWKGGSRDV